MIVEGGRCKNLCLSFSSTCNEERWAKRPAIDGRWVGVSFFPDEPAHPLKLDEQDKVGSPHSSLSFGLNESSFILI